jgi:hypothetical protein
MRAVIPAVASSFSVLRNRNFRVYLSGQAVSLIGTWLQNTAQSWVVWKLTGSTVNLGITNILPPLPRPRPGIKEKIQRKVAMNGRTPGRDENKLPRRRGHRVSILLMFKSSETGP